MLPLAGTMLVLPILISEDVRSILHLHGHAKRVQQHAAATNNEEKSIFWKKVVKSTVLW
jgi:hypothetical protein